MDEMKRPQTWEEVMTLHFQNKILDKDAFFILCHKNIRSGSAKTNFIIVENKKEFTKTWRSSMFPGDYNSQLKFDLFKEHYDVLIKRIYEDFFQSYNRKPNYTDIGNFFLLCPDKEPTIFMEHIGIDDTSYMLFRTEFKILLESPK